MGRRSMVAFATAFLVVLAAGGAAAGMFAGEGSAWSAGDLFGGPRIIVGEPTTSMETTTSTTSEHDAAEGSEPAPDTAHPDRTDPEKTETTTVTTAEPVDGGTEEDTTGKDLEDEPADTDPPDLVILHPENGATVETAELAFEGMTEPGARVYAGPYEADVDAEGHWRIVLRLEPGGNLARFVAKDAAGNVSDAAVKIYLATEGDAKTEKPRRAFTAHQKYGPENTEPYEKLYGTGTPGTVVHAVSPYGSGSTEVDASGNWWIKLHFEGLTAGDDLRIVVEADTGERAEFGFILVEKDHAFTAHQKYGPENTEPYEKLYGTGTPGTVVHAVSPYGSGSTEVDASGNWWIKLHFEGLTPGDDLRIVVEADTGERAEFGFVLVEKDHTFNANQKYGSCEEDIPYDVFYGTGVPGAKVWVESPYGGGATVVGTDGRWDVKVEFPDAPRDVPFEVVVESDGGRQVFGFVATGSSGEHG